MLFKDVMKLPVQTDNKIIFNELYKTVTKEDIEHGTNPESFSYAHLIEWAVFNKKYEEYYSYSKSNNYEIDEEKVKKDKIVFVKFNVAGEPLFGFYANYDGEPALMFPVKDGLKCVCL